jgi:hypothetical protein
MSSQIHVNKVRNKSRTGKLRKMENPGAMHKAEPIGIGNVSAKQASLFWKEYRFP